MILILSCIIYFLIGLVIAAWGEDAGWSRATQYTVAIGLCVTLSIVISAMAP